MLHVSIPERLTLGWNESSQSFQGQLQVLTSGRGRGGWEHGGSWPHGAQEPCSQAAIGHSQRKAAAEGQNLHLQPGSCPQEAPEWGHCPQPGPQHLTPGPVALSSPRPLFGEEQKACNLAKCSCALPKAQSAGRGDGGRTLPGGVRSGCSCIRLVESQPSAPLLPGQHSASLHY